MSEAPSEMPGATVAPRVGRRQRSSGGGSLLAQGEPMLWLTGGALAICLVMIIGLLALVVYRGARTFWPRSIYKITTHDDHVWIGEPDRVQSYQPTEQSLEGMDAAARARAEVKRGEQGGELIRRRFRTGNFELLNSHFTWIEDHSVSYGEEPIWALTVERELGGRFFGELIGFQIDGDRTTDDPEEAWQAYEEHHPEVEEFLEQRRRLERDVVGPINRRLARARRAVRQAEISYGADSPAVTEAQERLDQLDAEATDELLALRDQIAGIAEKAGRYAFIMSASNQPEVILPLDNIVRAYPANQLDREQKLAIYGERWWEFLTTEPREANSEGGVFPAIVGTLTMTILMSIAVVPFGVLAALYLKEYAKAGLVVSIIRIAINNLAGVPSIVFGVFGLGFFVYICGGSIDRAFYSAYDGPVFGQGGVFWASLTLALLTLPVVIVATEESLSAVPNSMREGSYACGASKWQTVWRIVLPRALPGVLTGLILAISRGAGEVAPLMLVGVLEHARELPIDGEFPFVHPERPIMHLGFSIYHSAFKSQNSEAAQPLVFTMTLLLITLVAVLNLVAIWMRSRLRRRYATSAF